MKIKLSLQQRLLIYCVLWITFCSSALIGSFVCTSKKAMLEMEASTSQILVKKLGEQSQKFLYSGDEKGLKDLLTTYNKLPHVLETKLRYKNIYYFGNDRNAPFQYQSENRTYRDSTSIFINQQPGLKTSKIFIFKPSDVKGIPNDKSSLTPDLYIEVTILLSVDHIFTEITQMIRKSIGMILLILFGGIVIGSKIAGSLVSPLKKLAEQTLSNPNTHDQNIDEIELISNHLIQLKETLDIKHKMFTKAQIATANLATKNRDLNTLLRIKNDFVFQISHEIKTPLSGIAMHIANIKNESLGKLNGVQKDRLERVSKISARLSRLVEPLIGFAIRENNHLAVLGKNIDMMASAKQINFSLKMQEQEYKVGCFLDTSLNGKQIFANPDHVEQILLNLMHNAIKASPPGSIVTVRAADYNKTHIKIYIEDTGFGINPQLSKKIFKEPIPDKLSESNGIGLYICKFLVEMNRGEIWFETNKIQGTTFSFTLPKIYPIIKSREIKDASQNTYCG